MARKLIENLPREPSSEPTGITIFHSLPAAAAPALGRLGPQARRGRLALPGSRVRSVAVSGRRNRCRRHDGVSSALHCDESGLEGRFYDSLQHCGCGNFNGTLPRSVELANVSVTCAASGVDFSDRACLFSFSASRRLTRFFSPALETQRVTIARRAARSLPA